MNVLVNSIQHKQTAHVLKFKMEIPIINIFSHSLFWHVCQTIRKLRALTARHGKTGQTRLTRPVWPTTRLTRNPIDPFKNDPWPDWPDTNPNPTCLFCHVYQRWVDWDLGVIFIKYLLILFYLICYVLHYSLSFFTCHLHFLFLL